MRIFLVGYMGSGKSSIGRPLAKRLGLDFVDTDTELERLSGVKVADFFAARGEAEFRRAESEILQELTLRNDLVVATGGGLPCFNDNMEAMNRAGLTIYLKMTPEKLLRRLENGRDKRPLLRGKNDEELLAFITESLAAREPVYARAKLIVACETMTDEYIANHVALYVENHKNDMP